MNHVLLRAMCGLVIVSPLIAAISYLMAVFDWALWELQRKHSYRPEPHRLVPGGRAKVSLVD